MDLTPRERFIVHLMMVDRFAVINALAYDHAMNLLNSNATHEPKMVNDSCPDCGYELAYGWAEDDWLEDGFSNNAWLGNPISQQEFDTTESKQVDPRIVLSTLRKQRCKNLSDEEAAWLAENVEEEKILSARHARPLHNQYRGIIPCIGFCRTRSVLWNGDSTRRGQALHGL